LTPEATVSVRGADPAGVPAWKRYGFLAALLIPFAPLTGWALGRATGAPDLFAWFAVAFYFVGIPLLDLAIGADRANPADPQCRRMAADRFYRSLTIAALPLQLAAVTLGAWVFASGALGPAGQIGWTLSIGFASGALGINVAHELVHKSSRLEQWTGGVLLALVCYGSFKIEHVRGHHLDIGTARDSTTARLNQDIYDYCLRALLGNPLKAWRLEAARLRGRGASAWTWGNEVLVWHAVSCALALAAFALFGWHGLVFFSGQALAAICLLETINYVEHYGLQRRQHADGSYERVSAQHSWESPALLSNLMLLQLQRHADHHMYPRRPYPLLRHSPQSPQLPAGYAAMVWLALVPPLWKRVMNPRVRAAT
jgi:alkane 1-monooxygenase